MYDAWFFKKEYLEDFEAMGVTEGYFADTSDDEETDELPWLQEPFSELAFIN